MSRYSASHGGSVTGLDVFTEAVMQEYESMFSRSNLEQVKDEVVTRCIERWLTLNTDEKSIFVDEAKSMTRQNGTPDDQVQRKQEILEHSEDSMYMTSDLEFCDQERPSLMRQRPFADLVLFNKELVTKLNRKEEGQYNNYNNNEDIQRADRLACHSNESSNNSRSNSEESESEIDVETLETDMCF